MHPVRLCPGGCQNISRLRLTLICLSFNTLLQSKPCQRSRPRQTFMALNHTIGYHLEVLVEFQYRLAQRSHVGFPQHRAVGTGRCHVEERSEGSGPRAFRSPWWMMMHGREYAAPFITLVQALLSSRTQRERRRWCQNKLQRSCGPSGELGVLPISISTDQCPISPWLGCMPPSQGTGMVQWAG